MGGTDRHPQDGEFGEGVLPSPPRPRCFEYSHTTLPAALPVVAAVWLPVVVAAAAEMAVEAAAMVELSRLDLGVVG